MQSIVVSDLHGNLRLYELTLRIADAWKISSVFIAGDLGPNGTSGPEPRDPAAEDIAGLQRRFFARRLIPLLDGFLTHHRHTHIYAIMGNDDRRVNESILLDFDETCPNFHLLNDRLVELRQSRQMRAFFAEAVPLLYVAGYPYVPPGAGLLMDWVKYENPVRLAPINMDPCLDIYDVGVLTTRDRPSTTIADDVADFGAYLADRGRSDGLIYAPERTIHVFHSPPYDTPLDWITPQGTYAFLRMPNHVGSSELRRFIERSRPYLVLSGHCHESVVYGDYKVDIGETRCVNPGSQAQSNVLSVVQFDVFAPTNMKQFFINAD